MRGNKELLELLLNYGINIHWHYKSLCNTVNWMYGVELIKLGERVSYIKADERLVLLSLIKKHRPPMLYIHEYRGDNFIKNYADLYLDKGEDSRYKEYRYYWMKGDVHSRIDYVKKLINIYN